MYLWHYYINRKAFIDTSHQYDINDILTCFKISNFLLFINYYVSLIPFALHN
jgi:hypothetical protein